MRKLLTLAALTAFAGVTPAAPPCEVQAGLMLAVVDPAAKPKLIDAAVKPTAGGTCPCVAAPGGVGTCGEFACPANGGRGPCSCTCSQPQTRHPADDGSGDMGYWQGDRLVARWFASTNTIRYYANGKYGPTVQCAAPQRPVYYNPPSFGGCPGGRCH